MTANHRTWAGRCQAADEPLPRSTPAPPLPAHESPVKRDGATLDWRISVPARPALVAVARRLVRSALVDCPRRDDVELVTSELVTNAIRHTPSGATGSVVTLRVRAAAGRVRVEVTDQGDPSWAAPLPAEDDDEYGRGLTIVHLLADRAGHEPAPGGQVCWAEIHGDVPVGLGPVRIRPA